MSEELGPKIVQFAKNNKGKIDGLPAAAQVISRQRPFKRYS